MYQLIDNIDRLWKRPHLKDSRLAEILIEHHSAIEAALRDGAIALIDDEDRRLVLSAATYLMETSATDAVINAPYTLETVAARWRHRGKPLRRPSLPIARDYDGIFYPLEKIRIRRPLSEYLKEWSHSELTNKITCAANMLNEALKLSD